ncbi:hypothetical protein [Roseibacillus persicicus]|uniref:Calx-beta domain-containing protein n=1 Tax=Roseibacillus persicicus TaxID=454148 RepID=A0A918WK88_9BACT|nr:hypothetical protein [Roseibacillus persicicus]GHC55145.1 hypothetical protein GCM10007100_22080 [Roseibacillus persicicus]
MKLAAALLVGLSSFAFSQEFTSGSDGSDGDLSLGTDSSRTLQVPEDGIFNFGTVTLGARSNLYFIANRANTPIYILAEGDVNLGGRIHVSAPSNMNRPQAGLGAPGGGFAGGTGGENPGDGLGPGGGKGGTEGSGSVYRGSGSYASRGTVAQTLTTNGEIYGNPLLIPLIGGSGGGGSTNGFGGAGGAGAICIASTTKITCNWNSYYQVPLFYAIGGASNSGTGSGSGGAVRLVAPDVSGTALFNLSGGNTSYAGYGRARIDSLNPSQFSLAASNSNSYITFGNNLVVFPPEQPSIRITEAAGRTIAPEVTDPVFVLLPVGAPSEQTVTLSVSDFGTVVPLRVTVTPEQGEKATYDTTIDNTAGGTTSGSVTVQIPAGTSTRVDAWTR